MTTELFTSHDAKDYLHQAVESESAYIGRITQEHYAILNLPIYGACEDCQKPENIKKTRFPDIKCWDISRVHLFTSNSDSDYIHANYVTGFEHATKFIVTQEPLESSLDDYWKMVWQERTKVIVMLNGFDPSGESSEKTDLTLKEFTISVNKIFLHDYYVEMIMTVHNIKVGRSRKVHHLKYLNWPKGNITDVPMFLNFLILVNRTQQYYYKEALTRQQPPTGPIIVYSSSGTGRAATFCAIDTCIYQLVNTASVSIPSVIIKIRQHRHSSIECLDHHIFINNVIVFLLVTLPSERNLYIELRSHFNSKDAYLLSSLPIA